MYFFLKRPNLIDAYSIVADEPDFIVVNKSAGISFHKEPELNNPGLLGLLKQDLNLESLYPVHRLDKITSGLLIFAKNEAANRALSIAFQQRQVNKFYLALAKGKPKKKQGAVIGDMEKSRRGMWRLLQSKNNPAVTHFFSKGIGEGLRLYILKPLTGKTHQLRVALKSQGVPILGDPLYSMLEEESVDRGYLHAFTLAFSFGGSQYCYQCLPKQGELFNQFLNADVIQDYSEPLSLNWPKYSI